MSLELLKEAIRVNNLMGEDTLQTVVENDIIVPDVKPDIARVLLLDGDAFITGCDAGTDRVVITGCLVCKILYISDDEAKTVKSMLSNMPFSYTMDMPGTRSGMKCRAKCMIEHMEHNMLNGRKINVKSIVSMNCKVYDEIEKDYSCGITGIEDIQVLKDTASVNSYLGSNKVNYVIKEDLEIPSSKPTICEILRNDVKISGKDFKVTDSKVIVKGDISVSTLYTGDDEAQSMQYMEHELAFTQFVDLDDVREDSMVSVDFELVDYKIEAFEDGDGEMRNIRAEITLNIFVDGLYKKTIDVLSDAYSPKSKINLERQQLTIDEVFSENRNQIIIKDVMNLDDCNPEVAEIFNVLSKHNLSECRIEEDKLIIEGSVQNNIIYLANNTDQPVFCYKKEIPFKQVVDVKGINKDMKVDADLEIEHCNYSMVSSNQVEMRTVLGVNTKVCAKNTLPVISKASESAMDETKMACQPSIIIYFSQSGDNLWKVAKKYCTTVEDILKINNLCEKEALNPGQQIIIPKKAI